jgi:murein L,D-transpeptidase YcbB/YkuD
MSQIIITEKQLELITNKVLNKNVMDENKDMKNKKVIKLTENDLRNIVKRVIKEQDENYNYNKAVQSFLIKKKITDSNNRPIEKDGSIGTLDNDSKSAQAISKYQLRIGVKPDGVFGNETTEKMKTKFPNDYKLWLECKSEEGDLFDKGAHFFGLD